MHYRVIPPTRTQISGTCRAFPQVFCRILRLQKVFTARHRPLPWSFIAAECGYFDQARFIHDFKALSGQTPAMYFSEAHEMSEYFTRKNRLSDFYNTTA